MSVTLEDLLAQIGDCGRYQFLLVPISFASIPLSVWGMMMMVFGAKEPDWWCESRDVSPASFGYFTSQTTGDTINGSVKADGVTHFWRVNGTGGGVEHENVTTLENGRLKFCSDGNESVQLQCDRVVFASGENTIVSEFQLVCDMAWVPSLIISLQMVGVLTGSVLAGQMGDSWGRKKTLMAMVILQTVFNLVAVFSTSWEMFAIMRTLIGVTVGGLVSTTFAYPAEFVGVKWRAVLGSIPIWGIGICSFSLAVWALRDWRHIHIATAVCSGATIPGWIFLPESVRWLSVKGHVDKAQHVLQTIARWNGRKAPDVEQMHEFFSQKREAKSRRYTFIHLFAGRQMCKLSLIVGYMWLACSLTYFGISFNIHNLSGDFYFNFFLMSLVELPVALFAYHLMTWFGRRWACALSFMVVALTSLAIIPVYFFAPPEYGGTLSNALAMAGRMALNLGWSCMSVFNAELYPTVVRNLGLGYGNMMARVSGILVPYVLAGAESKPYIFYIIIGVAMTLVALCSLLLRETKGQPLQDDLPGRQNRAAASEFVLNGQLEGEKMLRVAAP